MNLGITSWTTFCDYISIQTRWITYCQQIPSPNLANSVNIWSYIFKLALSQNDGKKTAWNTVAIFLINFTKPLSRTFPIFLMSSFLLFQILLRTFFQSLSLYPWHFQFKQLHSNLTLESLWICSQNVPSRSFWERGDTSLCYDQRTKKSVFAIMDPIPSVTLEFRKFKIRDLNWKG
jgi:hypothetical protein